MKACYSELVLITKIHIKVNCSFFINLAQLWRLENSKEVQISGGHMFSFLENKRGPWKFGDRLWSLPILHSRKFIDFDIKSVHLKTNLDDFFC